MNYTIKKTFLVFQLSFFTLFAAAQKERIDDLVPFKKGSKWGLVHHDGRIFYPSIFDKIELQEVYVDSKLRFSVFDKDFEFRDSLVQVTYKNEPYYLTRDKKLLSQAQYKKLRHKQREVLVDATDFVNDVNSSKKEPDADTFPYNLLSPEHGTYRDDSTTYFKTVFGKKVKVVAQPRNTDLRFYIDGRRIVQFDSWDFSLSDIEKGNGKFSGAVAAKKNNEYGYIDFEKEQVTIPFGDDKLFHCDQNPDWLFYYNRKYGIITKKNEKIGREFEKLVEMVFPGGKYGPVMIVKTEHKEYQFYYPEKDSLSSQKYTDIQEIFNFGSDYLSNKINEPLFWVSQGDGSGLVTLDGKIVVPLSYDKMEQYRSTIIWIRKKNKLGFVDLKNNYRRTEPVYDERLNLFDDYELNFTVRGLLYYLFLVRKGNKTFYVDNFGKEFISN